MDNKLYYIVFVMSSSGLFRFAVTINPDEDTDFCEDAVDYFSEPEYQKYWRDKIKEEDIQIVDLQMIDGVVT